MKGIVRIKNKDYALDFSIKSFWQELQEFLKVAYMVTIFGYSAPKSDQSAIDLLKTAWGDTSKRNLEEIEIIDIRSEEDVCESWSEFIHTHHYHYCSNFFSSTLAKCPRRSCEATFDRLMNCRWLKGNSGFKADYNFDDVNQLLSNLFNEEQEKDINKEFLTHDY